MSPSRTLGVKSGDPVFRGSSDLNILRNESLERYTSTRIGGPADWLLAAERVQTVIEVIKAAQRQGVAWRVLGSGSNVLVADTGIRGLVVINRTRCSVIEDRGLVFAESGVNLSSLARQCISRGLAGLEWAVSVPGTVGGAVVGNAGAHGGDTASVLDRAVVLGPDGTLAQWSAERFEYGYRDSLFKRMAHDQTPVVLAVVFSLAPDDSDKLTRKASDYVARRKATQPSGASMGSIFRNPPGDYAGRLIEAVGLKGTRIGGAQISPIHANFFINTGSATAADFKALIDLAKETVQERFGVQLELEIELIGDWGNRVS